MSKHALVIWGGWDGHTPKQSVDRFIPFLEQNGFAVTVNTDNLLMSATSMSREFSLLAAEADWSLDDLEAATLVAAWAGFAHRDVLTRIVVEQILPGYDAARGL